MQPSDSQLLGAGAAVATGVATVVALNRPDALTIGIAAAAAVAWGASAAMVARHERRLGTVRFGGPEKVDSGARSLPDITACEDVGALQSLCVLAEASPTLTTVSLGEAVVELASTASQSSGTVGVLGQLRPAGGFVVELKGAASSNAYDSLNLSLSNLHLQTTQGRGDLISVRKKKPANSEHIELIGFHAIPESPRHTFEGLRQLLRSIQHRCGAVVEEVLLSPTNLFGAFQAEGHAVLGFKDREGVEQFHGQLIRWQQELRRDGWKLTQFSPI